MDILDFVMRMNGRPFLIKPEPTPVIDMANLKKIALLALKVLTISCYFHYKRECFSIGFTAGILTRFLTEYDFKLQKIHRSLEKDPATFLKVAAMSHIILLPESLDLGAAAGGFYSGICLAKLCH